MWRTCDTHTHSCMHSSVCPTGSRGEICDHSLPSFSPRMHETERRSSNTVFKMLSLSASVCLHLVLLFEVLVLVSTGDRQTLATPKEGKEQGNPLPFLAQRMASWPFMRLRGFNKRSGIQWPVSKDVPEMSIRGSVNPSRGDQGFGFSLSSLKSPAFIFPSSGHKSSLKDETPAKERKHEDSSMRTRQGHTAQPDHLMLLDLSSLHPDSFPSTADETRMQDMRPSRDRLASWYHQQPETFDRRYSFLETNAIPDIGSYRFTDPNDNEVSVVPNWELTPEDFFSWRSGAGVGDQTMGRGSGRTSGGFGSSFEGDAGDALSDFLLGYNTDPEAVNFPGRQYLIGKRRPQPHLTSKSGSRLSHRSEKPSLEKTVNYGITGSAADDLRLEENSRKQQQEEEKKS